MKEILLMMYAIQCAHIGHANHAYTIIGYVRAEKVGAVSMVARATDFSSEIENSPMLKNHRETSGLLISSIYSIYELK